MRTGDTVTDLGLYVSDCCGVEVVFDTGDAFERCPRCLHRCIWDEEEELEMTDEMDRLIAA